MLTPDEMDLIAQVVVALKRIAAALERFEPAGPEPCAHAEIEDAPDSTFGNPKRICKACKEPV